MSDKKQNLRENLQKIWQSEELNREEKLVLAILWSRADSQDKITVEPEMIARDAGLRPAEIRKILIKLDNTSWLELVDGSAKEEQQHNLTVEFTEDKFTEDKSKINPESKPPAFLTDKKELTDKEELVYCWQNHFPGRLLTPTEYNHLISYLEKGMELELLNKLIAYAAENARGNPVSYLKKILNDLLENEVTTWRGYQRSSEGEMQNGEKSLSEDHRGKEEREKLEDVEELEKRGWN